MSAPEEKQPDQQGIVALLAQEREVPVDDVARRCEHGHAALAIGAHITSFLHSFATRDPREILRNRGVEGLALPAAGRPPLVAQRLLVPLGPSRAAASMVAKAAARS